MTTTLRIGTRGSELARWQARKVQETLKKQQGVASELVVIHTSGDRETSKVLFEVGGSGFFTKELQAALIEKKVDLVVHSLKDLPIAEPEGLVLGAVCFREDPRELLIARRDALGDGAMFLKPAARLGTSSLRRRAQALAKQPDLIIEPLRGNIPTRIRKLREGLYDAILIAFAGVHRLGLDLSDLAVFKLPLEVILPAPAQGALGIEVRAHDTRTLALVRQLDEPDLRAEVSAERQVLLSLGGGCHLPLASFCKKEDGFFHLRAVLGHFGENLTFKHLTVGEARGLTPEEAAANVLPHLKG